MNDPHDRGTSVNERWELRLASPTSFTNNAAHRAGAFMSLNTNDYNFEETYGRPYKTPTITYADDTVFEDNRSFVSSGLPCPPCAVYDLGNDDPILTHFDGSSAIPTAYDAFPQQFRASLSCCVYGLVSAVGGR